MRAQLVNQRDLTVDELATLMDTIMLSQVSLHNLMAEVDSDRHNNEVFTVNQCSLSSPIQGETGDLLVPRQILQGRQVLLPALLLVGKLASGGSRD